jgi:hypothetical protein
MADSSKTSNSDSPDPGKLYYGLKVTSPWQSSDIPSDEDVTFTGPVFPRVSRSQRAKGTPGPGTSPSTA